MVDKRYKIHFTPEKGWTNDPNGLIYIDGVYHLFYQHYPQDTKWGPMHWGHAISRDLTTWEYLPIALYPTEEEYAFSGSAILDTENVSGLGEQGQTVLLLFFTGHNPKTGEQVQNIAYSRDYIHFQKYAENPVINNRMEDRDYKKDFRDPKVFCDPAGGFGMVLAAGDKIDFYHSENLLQWKSVGAFCPKDYGFAGLCECPDLFFLDSEEGKKCILSMSMIFMEEGASEETHIMQYFVGEMQNGLFVNTQEFAREQLLDFGPDNYAMVTFANSPKPMMLGWGEDWNKARINTAKEFFGKMTLARELSLKKGRGGYRICQKPIYCMKENTEDLWQKEVNLKTGETYEDSDGSKLRIVNEGNSLFINGKRILRRKSGDCSMLLLQDCGYYEVFGDDGEIVFSFNA